MASRALCKLGIVVGLANYLACAITAALISGDTLHGHVAHHHFFLAANGTWIEVSRALFLFCKWQAYSLLITFPLGLMGAWFLKPGGNTVFIGGHRDAHLSSDTA